MVGRKGEMVPDGFPWPREHRKYQDFKPSFCADVHDQLPALCDSAAQLVRGEWRRYNAETCHKVITDPELGRVGLIVRPRRSI